MKRREFITLIGGGAAALVARPPAPRAQQPALKRIGVLWNGAGTELIQQSYLTAFRQTLRDLGWVEGQNLHTELRFNGGDAERARIHAAEVVGLAPDVILASSTTNLLALQRATRSLPIVFVAVSDPVAQGIVTNLAKPGGNVTGFSVLEFSVGGKWVELLKQVAPELARVAVVFNPDTSPQSKYYLRAIETAAGSIGVQTVATPVRAATEIEPAIASFARQPNGGLILPTDSFTLLHEELVVEAASRHHLPAVYGSVDFTRIGGLMHYGPGGSGGVAQYRQAAAYVDRILKGAKPGDLPVQLAVNYRLIVNMKTAKALGLTVPLPLLGRADEVIE